MGKKTKVGKHRQDVFYKKAKEAGYRARAAFKLIQLNQKFDFLAKSKVCVDLCAAPGSWMQVARKYMPPSSIIVGVDLVPIKNIPNTLSIIGDITTEKVRTELKATLKTWKADLVLHDGAPNVGQNWVFDAYQQNLLVLSSFKLGCELLQKGGTFVTKVFRSKDYFSLEYVFRKLFKSVEATKPAASRFESAEIFVVCKGYLAPNHVDPEFFDHKSVFQEVDPEPDTKINLLKPDKVRRKAIGYEEGVNVLYKPNSVSTFINSAEFLAVLQEANALTFETEEDKVYAKSRHTTQEILECCKDIKVLAKRELRLLLNWRKHIRADINLVIAKEKKKEIEDKKARGEFIEKVVDEDEELDKIDEEVQAIQTENAKMNKKLKKKAEKSRLKLEEKMRLKMVIPGDPGPTEQSNSGLFNLKSFDKVKSVDEVVDAAADCVIDSDDDVDEMDFGTKQKTETYKIGSTYLDKTGRFYKDARTASDSEDDSSATDSDAEDLGIERQERKKKVSFAPQVDDDEDLDSDEEVEDTNPLVTDLMGDKPLNKRQMKAESWFSKDIFKDLENEEDEDFEIDMEIRTFTKKGGEIISKPDKSDQGYQSGTSDIEKAADAPDSASEGDTDSDIDSESETEGEKATIHKPKLIGSQHINGSTKVTKKQKKEQLKRQLDPTGKALATQMIKSKKARRDITDAAWNRYMFGDEDLPEWFEKDEEKFNKPMIEVEPADLRMYRNEAKPVDARSIKKVVEAKARKQRRVKKRMDRAKKKAEVITNNEDMNTREKASELKKLYKRALDPLKKKDVQYVVMRRGTKGQKPSGTKGPYKMVDKRLKKDTKSQLRAKAKQGKRRRSRK